MYNCSLSLIKSDISAGNSLSVSQHTAISLSHWVKGGNSGTLSYLSDFAYNNGFMQHIYGALASSIILL